MAWWSGLLFWRRERRIAQNVAVDDTGLERVQGRDYVEGAPYALPRDTTEISRVDFQHFMVRYHLKGNYAAPLRQPRAILDVGAGSGRWVIEMAEQFPEARVVGVDLTLDGFPPPERRPRNVEFATGNVLERLPFADETFDFVRQRFLVAALPVARWPEVVRELARVTRRGGWVELLEAGDMYRRNGSQQLGPAMTTISNALTPMLASRGIDPRVVRNIGTWLQGAGLVNVVYRDDRSIPPLSFGRTYGGRLGVMLKEDHLSAFRAMRPLAERLGADPAEFDRALDMLPDEFEREGYYWPLFLAYGQRP